MFCKKCGNPVEDNADECPFCSSAIENNTEPVSEVDAAEKKSSKGLSSAGITLGIIGIILAWLFALLGYVFGGGSLALGLVARNKDNTNKKSKAAIVLGAVAIICSAINSVMGIILMTQAQLYL